MQQIRLAFGRNQDQRTEAYHIYRSSSHDGRVPFQLIMKVKHPRQATAITTKEIARKRGAGYQLKQRHILPNEGFRVYRGGKLIDSHTYDVDAANGLLYLTEETEEAIEVEYSFDGIEVIDAPEANPAEVVQYFGAPLVMSRRPSPPANLSLLPTDEGMRINFDVQPTEGYDFFYRIEAVNEDGQRSNPTAPVHLRIDDGVTGIVLERENERREWIPEEFPGYELYLVDRHADTEPPEGLSGFRAEVEEEDGRYVAFHWDTPLRNERTNLSPRYRMRTRGLNNMTSLPSKVVGPEVVKSGLAAVEIYEKPAAKGHPVYGDPEASKVAEIPATEEGLYRHPLETDGSYAYSVFVVDVAGNHSIASTAIITV